MVVPFETKLNPFTIKTAEPYRRAEDIRNIFAYPPEYENYVVPDNLIIIGSRGCGKTVLLKHLSLSVQSPEEEEEEEETVDRSFCGIYIQRLLQLSDLLQIYRRGSGKTDKFEHYFTLKVICETAWQFSQTSISTKIKTKVSNVIMNTLGIKNPKRDIDSLYTHLDEAVMYFEQYVTSDPVSEMREPSGLRIQNLGTLLTFLRHLSKQIQPLPLICLLIDDFQDYEELGRLLLNKIMSHKFLDFLCVKVAARRLSFSTKDLSIEPFRDYKIRILDSDPNDFEWLSFLRGTANSRLRDRWELSVNELQRINIDTLLPPLIPESIQWDRQKSPGQNLMKIGKKNMRQKCFCGFEVIAKVAMVNPFEFLEICDIAYALEEKRRGGLVTIPPGISPEVQSKAVLEKVRNYVNVELFAKSEYSQFFFGIRSLLINLAKHLEQNQNPPSFEGARFYLSEDISPEYRGLLREAIIERDLYVPDKQLVSLLLNPILDVREIEINRLICPYYGISWEYVGKYPVAETTLKEYFRKRYGEPIRSKQQRPLVEGQELWTESLFQEPKNLWVFEAQPHSTEENRIKRTVNSLRKEAQTTKGRSLPGENIYYMNEEIARQMWAPRFSDYLGEQAIKEALYLVADVTETFKTGVAYEIGTAFGYKKPVFIFWDSIRIGREFNGERDKVSWHSFIEQHDLKEWTSKYERKVSFKKWYRTHIDDIGQKNSGNVKCPIRKFEQKQCPYENFMREKIDKPYVLFQVQNRGPEEFTKSFLSQHNCYPIQRSDVPKAADDVCFKCICIQASKFQIIDCSARQKEVKGDPACALELGFAYALHKENTLMLYDADKNPEPVVMFPGSRHGWHNITLENDIKEKLQEFLSRFPEFGGIKK